MNDELNSYKSLCLKHKAFFSSVNKSLFALRNYDMLSDSIVWSDEIKGCQSNLEKMIVVRPLLRHRMCIILGQDNKDHQEEWDIAKEIFPKWIGFLEKRRRFSKAIKSYYEDNHSNLEKTLHALNKELDE